MQKPAEHKNYSRKIVFPAKVFAHLTVWLLAAQTTIAQLAVGIEGGYTHNYFNSHNNGAPVKNKQLAGFNTALIVHYPVKHWLAIQSGAGIIQKNYSFNRTGNYTGVYQSFTNTYAYIPLTVLAAWNHKKINYYGKLGWYAAYWLSARTTGAVPNLLNTYSNVNNNGIITDYFLLTRYNEKYVFNKRTDRRFETGWLAGAGLSCTITSRISVFAEGKYYYSLTDQQKNYSLTHIPGYNQTVNIAVGGLLSFTKTNSR